jgi:hypothetical protein
MLIWGHYSDKYNERRWNLTGSCSYSEALKRQMVEETLAPGGRSWGRAIM